MGAQQQADGPDFALGVASADIPEGATLAGRVGDKPVLVSRRGGAFFAVGGACTHYGGPLGEGLVTGDQVRCPWHHACFSVRTGEALAAPAFNRLARWRVDVEGDTVFVREHLKEEAKPEHAPTAKHPGRIVIVGGGAAGFAAADMLRRRGFAGGLTMLSADASAPYDRPNLSKDYLAGTAPEDWMPLKDDAFYGKHGIELRLGAEATAIDLRAREVKTKDGAGIGYDALLLATGAAPIRLPTPGFERPNVHVLRSMADCRAIVAAAERAKSVAIIGASFIGLETAASMRARGLETHVIAPEGTPLERVLGAEVGRFVRAVHEQQGVHFHLGRTAESFDGERVRLNGGGEIVADFVILGVGVRPNVDLAAKAGLQVDNGILVDARMQTSAAGVFAAGDAARYPDPRLGEAIRVEHWVAAERQGQAAAASMLGDAAPFAETPFFWSQHYDHTIRYVGRAAKWDRIDVAGSIDAANFTVRYFDGARLLAAASLNRDSDALAIQEEMNKEAQAALV